MIIIWIFVVHYGTTISLAIYWNLIDWEGGIHFTSLYLSWWYWHSKYCISIPVNWRVAINFYDWIESLSIIEMMVICSMWTHKPHNILLIHFKRTRCLLQLLKISPFDLHLFMTYRPFFCIRSISPSISLQVVANILCNYTKPLEKSKKFAHRIFSIIIDASIIHLCSF